METAGVRFPLSNIERLASLQVGDPVTPSDNFC